MSSGETQRVVRHAGGMAASLYVSRLAIMARGIIAARFLGPSGFGLWNAFQLIWEYGQYVHLGVLNGLSKELPFKLGRGETAEVERLQDVGLGAMLFTSVGSWVLLMVGVLGFHRGDLSTLMVCGTAVAGGVVVIEEAILTYVTVLRAYGRIHLISFTEIAHALLNLAVSVLLLLKFGLPGLLAAWIATRAAAFAYMASASGIRFHPRLRWRPSLFLLRRGGWIFLYLVMAALIRTLDRVVILGRLGVESLGYYAIAATAAGLVANIPAAVTFVLYPILLRRYGETGRPGALAGLLGRPTLALAAGVPIVLVVIWLLIQVPVFYVLPEYMGAIPALRILLVGSVFASLAQVPVFFLLAVDRDPSIVLLSGAGAALGFLLCSLAARAGLGIEGVAGAKTIADLVYGTVVVWYAGCLGSGSARGGVKLVLRSLLPAAYVTAVFLVVGALAGWPDWRPLGPDTMASLARVGLVAVLTVPFLWFYTRHAGLQAVWRELKGARAVASAPAEEEGPR